MAAGYRMPYPIPRSALHGYNGQYRVAPIHTDSTLYDATADPPRYGHYLKPPSDNRDWPIMSVGARRQYATRSDDKIRDGMWHQDNYIVAPTQYVPHTLPNVEMGAPNNAPNTDFPMFIHVPPRAAAGKNHIEGNPNGLRMLLTSPAKYNAQFSRHLSTRNVSQTGTLGRVSKAAANAPTLV